MPDPHELSARAASLAAEAIAAVQQGHLAERIEAAILSALSPVVLDERQRCSTIAEQRAAMWQGTKLNDPAWPTEGRREARERYKEAIAIADAIRVGAVVLPPA